MRDSPETLEWYDECIQRNIQVHAQIPLGYQPSIVYCRTGRRRVLTPARRLEQRRKSINDSNTTLDAHDFKLPEHMSTVSSDFIERLSQPMLDVPSTSTPRTVNILTTWPHALSTVR